MVRGAQRYSAVSRLGVCISGEATRSFMVERPCQMLVERHGGEVPRSFAELESLPGVGHKTASVVLAIAFRMPTFPVDTHIHRRVPMHSS